MTSDHGPERGLEQCELALREILSALPAKGRMNASDVGWLRMVAKAGLGDRVLDAELTTVEAIHLRTQVAALTAARDAAQELIEYHNACSCSRCENLRAAIAHATRAASAAGEGE